MLSKPIKISKKEDLAAVVKRIKNTREPELTFDVEKGSPLLASADHLKLIKKTGEVLGKTIWIQTEDLNGMMMARKAGVLAAADDTADAKAVRPTKGPRPGNLSDI